MTSSCRSGSVRRLWRGGAFILLLALIAALAAFAAPAAQAGQGSIEGTVTAGNNPVYYLGNPALQNIGVYAFEAIPDPLVDFTAYSPLGWLGFDQFSPIDLSLAVGSTHTDIYGHFVLNVPVGINPMKYYVWYQDDWSPENMWLGQWYDQQSPWDPMFDENGIDFVTVNDNQSTETTQCLTRASHIKGTVTDGVDGLADIGVYVYISDVPTTTADAPEDLGAWIQAIEAGDISDRRAVTGDGIGLNDPGLGVFDIGQLNPTSGWDTTNTVPPTRYYVYFSASGLDLPGTLNQWAPQWWDCVAPWDVNGSPTEIFMDFGQDAAAPNLNSDITLAAPGSIEGQVTSWMQMGIEGIQVDAYPAWTELFASPVHIILGSDLTDDEGYYAIEGLAPSHFVDSFGFADASPYLVKFSDPFEYYQTEWFSAKPIATELLVAADPFSRVLVANAITVLAGKVYGDVDASLAVIPHIYWMGPYWALTNNPDPQRPPFELTIHGQGLNNLNFPAVWIEQAPWVAPWTMVFAYKVSVAEDGSSLTAWFDFVANPAPVGLYNVFVDGTGQFKDYGVDAWDYDSGPFPINVPDPFPLEPTYDGYNNYWQEGLGYLQLIGFTTPVPPPIDPYTPPPGPRPPTPTPTPTPTVTPTPTPTPSPGAITTKAPSSATVKRGKVATLKYQVNEAVLGGTANVTIKIKKSGKIVKTLRIANARMNSTQKATFTCRLAKGSYTFYVSATTAAGGRSTNTAFNRLTVK